MKKHAPPADGTQEARQSGDSRSAHPRIPCRSEDGGQKYRDKLVEVTGGIVERVDGESAVVYPSGKKGPNRIRVSFKPSMKAQLARYKPGDGILFQGKCESRAGADVVIKLAEFAE